MFDGGHIEADSNVNTTLKGPLWDPARGYPHHVNLKVDGDMETNVGGDYKLEVGGSVTVKGGSTIKMNASSINLN